MYPPFRGISFLEDELGPSAVREFCLWLALDYLPTKVFVLMLSPILVVSIYEMLPPASHSVCLDIRVAGNT